MYIPKHFILEEFLPAQFFAENVAYYGIRLWLIFDERILDAADRLRGMYGPMVANTWVYGGRHQYRGYRDPDCTVGAKLSQHRFGRGLDLVPLKADVDEIRHDIKDKPTGWYGVNCIEEEVSWLHIDCRNHDGGYVKLIYPRKGGP